MPRPLQSEPDICLLLEGTYPYVSGGVSTWVHQIMTSLPDLTFAVFYIGSERVPGASYQYRIPSNVVRTDEFYLHARTGARRGPAVSPTPVHEALRVLLALPPEDAAASHALARLSATVAALAPQLAFNAFWRDQGTWQVIRELYQNHAGEGSFLEFFWSLRSLAEPVWRLMAAVPQVPRARIYHSLCTGYAGFAGALAARHHGGAFLLSEHGIYVRERIADLQKARWIHDPPVLRPDLQQQPALLRQIWTGLFVLLGRFAYHTAGRITTLFQRNAAYQMELGAPPEKLEIIPNGVHPPDFLAVHRQRALLLAAQPQRQCVGFLGRVVSIKDVKTLLQAARLTVDDLPRARFLIAGPLDEEPAYAAACQDWCVRLGLSGHVHFAGPQERDTVLPAMDVMALTSLSEGLPFVILEAFAAGLPCVSTDVGSCRELIFGQAAENPACGQAGFIVPVGDARRLAAALIRLLEDRPLAIRMGAAGLLRATAYYSRGQVVHRYHQLYQLLAG